MNPMFRNMLIALATSMAFSIPYILLVPKRLLEYKSDRIRREAKAAGRVVTGHLDTMRRLRYDPDMKGRHGANWEAWARYKYEVGGREYSWTGYADTTDLPKTMTFYYPAGKPKKAVPERYDEAGGRALLMACIPFLAWLVSYWSIGLIWPAV